MNTRTHYYRLNDLYVRNNNSWTSQFINYHSANSFPQTLRTPILEKSCLNSYNFYLFLTFKNQFALAGYFLRTGDCGSDTNFYIPSYVDNVKYFCASTVIAGRHTFARILWLEFTTCPPGPWSSFSKGTVCSAASKVCFTYSSLAYIYIYIYIMQGTTPRCSNSKTGFDLVNCNSVLIMAYTLYYFCYLHILILFGMDKWGLYGPSDVNFVMHWCVDFFI